MRNKAVILIWGLVFSIFLTGCGGKAAPGGSAKDPAAEPLKALNTYLEGLRDHDFEKLKQTVSYAVYQSWPPNKEFREKMLTSQEKSIGTIKKWAFGSKPYVDEINNQAIIQIRLNTTKYFYVIDYDMRKQDRWYVFGSNIVSRSPVGKQKNSSVPGAGNDIDKVLDMLKQKAYHSQPQKSK